MSKKSLKDLSLAKKTVLMRVDFNVPLSEDGQKVMDSTRIRLAIPSIRYILDQGSRLILMSHLGRPKGEVVQNMRLGPVAKTLAQLLNQDVMMASDSIGPQVQEQVRNLKPGQVILLENLRFYRQETDNDSAFARQLASLADVYVNDAFGAAHRKHASTEGITHYLVSVTGFLMEKELAYLSKIKDSSEHPYVAIIGGAKVSTKLPVLHALLDKVDTLILGGGMAYNFLKAQGQNIGDSLFERKYVTQTQGIIQKAQEKRIELITPIDHQVWNTKNNTTEKQTDFIKEGCRGMDIGPQTLALIREKLEMARVVFWGGPMGVFEQEPFHEGTFQVAKILSEVSATSVVAGGDLLAAVARGGFSKGMDHISSGGGASLALISGQELPALSALRNR